MESDSACLWQQLERFELDEPGAEFPFISRLAREQGWTHAQAARAIREYKRFVLLAVTADHPVSPSETIDHVWHLHLLYTRSYWQRMCRDLLGRELHHEPTRGGHSEREKFAAWYAQTLASYETCFGESPPRDIWPVKPSRKTPAWLKKFISLFSC